MPRLLIVLVAVSSSLRAQSDPDAPVDLTCRIVAVGEDRSDVSLSWENSALYSVIVIRRDGIPLAALGPTATEYLDEDVPTGLFQYEVAGRLALRDAISDCEVEVTRVPGGPDSPARLVASVDLGPVDFPNGLVHVSGEGLEDGATRSVFCGPADDPRDARSNLGTEAEPPAPFLYFAARGSAVSNIGTFLIAAVVFDDMDRPGVEVVADFRAADGELRRAAEIHTLPGEDGWSTRFWAIEDAGFAGDGESPDFRIGSGDGSSLCIDEVVLFDADPAAPEFATFRRGDANSDGVVDLTDAVFKLRYLFLLGRTPGCLDAVDYDDNGRINIEGVIGILSYLFRGGELPPAPGLDACGRDPTRDNFPSAECVYVACDR